MYIPFKGFFGKSLRVVFIDSIMLLMNLLTSLTIFVFNIIEKVFELVNKKVNV